VAKNVYGVTVTNTITVNLASPVTLLYDNNGNLTNDGARTFGYDAENQLTNVFMPGQWRSDFIYDGLGRRRIVRQYAWSGSAWSKTNEVHIIYDGYLPIQERDSNDNVLVTYTRGLDLSGNLGAGLPRQSEATAGGIGGLLARTDANGSTFYHSDGAGNITALMDGQEDIVARYMYGPFGKLIGQWGPMASANEMQFSSMPRDPLSGLSLYPFRAYEPNFQRWLNQDPIQEFGGINLYRAMNNDPLNEVDPLGLLSGIEEQEAQVAEEAAGEGNAGDEFGPLGYLAAAGLAVSAGFLTADSAEAYQWIQQNQQTAQNDQRIQQMEQQLQNMPKTAPAAPPTKPPKPPCNNIVKGFPGDQNERHHRLPKQFKDWFSDPRRGLNIEDFTKEMPMQWHRGADIGLHPNGYNDAWGDFIEQNPGASAEETLQYLNNLENSMGFGILPVD
jgi:RHS repeat-associated protein